jgi:hypothetical protein
MGARPQQVRDDLPIGGTDQRCIAPLLNGNYGAVVTFVKETATHAVRLSLESPASTNGTPSLTPGERPRSGA